MSKIAYLPIWKSKASAAERFYELYMLAKEHPERFVKVAVVYQEKLPREGNWTQIRQISSGCNTDELIGILEQGKLEVIRNSREDD